MLFNLLKSSVVLEEICEILVKSVESFIDGQGYRVTSSGHQTCLRMLLFQRKKQCDHAPGTPPRPDTAKAYMIKVNQDSILLKFSEI